MPYNRNRLNYPFNYRTVIEQDSSRAVSIGNPQTDDNCNFYVLQLTDDERLKLGSALYAGLDLIYPDEFLDLFQIWLNAWSNPNTFPPPTGVCAVDLCQLILQCIEDTPELQQVISKYSNVSNISTTTPPNPDLESLNIVSGVTCNNDNLFGAITELVDLLNAWSEDILEIFVNAPFALARLGDIIEAIPFVGEMPGDDAFQFVESFLEDINDAYQASYTTQLRDEFRCDLFCIAKDTCQLDFEQVRDYFYNRAGATLDGSNPLALMEDILANNWIGTATVDIMHFMFMSMLTFGEKLFDVDLGQLHQQLNSIYNDPDGDWVTLCACANTWESVLDLTISDYGAIYELYDSSEPGGLWVNGKGIEAVNVYSGGIPRTQLFCHWDFDQTQITSYEASLHFREGSVSGGHQTYLAIWNRLYNGASFDVPTANEWVYQDFTYNVLNEWVSQQQDIDVTSDEFSLYMRPDDAGHTGEAWISQLILRGTGTKPSQLP